MNINASEQCGCAHAPGSLYLSGSAFAMGCVFQAVVVGMTMPSQCFRYLLQVCRGEALPDAIGRPS